MDARAARDALAQLTPAERAVLEEFCELAATHTEQEMDRIMHEWASADVDLNTPRATGTRSRFDAVFRALFPEAPS